MLLSRRLTIGIAALTTAAFPLALAVAGGSAPAQAYGEFAIAALLAAPAISIALAIERRGAIGWLGPMLALAGALPAVVLLGDIFKQGPLGAYLVPLSEGDWVLLYL